MLEMVQSHPVSLLSFASVLRFSAGATTSHGLATLTQPSSGRSAHTRLHCSGPEGCRRNSLEGKSSCCTALAAAGMQRIRCRGRKFSGHLVPFQLVWSWVRPGTTQAGCAGGNGSPHSTTIPCENHSTVRILMIAPEPFFEPRGTPFSEFHRIRALTALAVPIGVDLPQDGGTQYDHVPG